VSDLGGSSMVVHNIYIFGRDGACLYYHEWLRPKPVRDGAGSISDDQKMMFGLFFSLKTFAAAMDPKCALCFLLVADGHYANNLAIHVEDCALRDPTELFSQPAATAAPVLCAGPNRMRSWVHRCALGRTVASTASEQITTNCTFLRHSGK
jgi:Sybindin-like family